MSDDVEYNKKCNLDLQLVLNISIRKEKMLREIRDILMSYLQLEMSEIEVRLAFLNLPFSAELQYAMSILLDITKVMAYISYLDVIMYDDGDDLDGSI